MVATAETISPPESRRQRFFRSGIQIGMCVDCAASPRSSASSLVHNSLVSLGLGGENPLLTVQSAALPQYSRSEVLGSGFWRSHSGNDPINNLVTRGNKGVYVETKLTISKLQERTINQLRNAVREAGKKGYSVILQVARKATDKEEAKLLKALGKDVYNKVKIVSTQTDLFKAVETALK